MQRPSNLIIAFALAIASAFLAYAFSRLFFRAIAPPEIEIEEDYESQLYNRSGIICHDYKNRI